MKKKSVFFRLVLTGFLLSFLLAFPAKAQNQKFVFVKGKDVFTPDGQKLLLKGINIGNWLLPEGYMFKFKHASSPRLINDVFNQLIGESEARKFWNDFRRDYITEEDIQFIKASGFNSIRIPFSYRLFVSGHDESKLEGPGYALLDSVMNWCEKHGLYTVLDMHGAPGGQTGDNIDDSYAYPFLFESKENCDLTIRIWKLLAERYAGYRHLVGYDLLNEPIAHYFSKDTLNPLLEPLYKDITKAIRAVDKDHIIFYGGAQWNSNFSVFGKPFDDKAIYTFHKYWTDTTYSNIADYVDYANKYNVPLWLGESGENSNEWIASFRRLCEANNIGWCFWPYKKLDATAGVVSIPLTTEFEAIIEFANKPRTDFAEVRANRPPQATIKKALDDYRNNMKLKNCKVNTEYIKALGLNAE
ncbi:MAG: glycoside hydrolase family 5 protein [Ignavibacteriales bacterium]|nr:glycoside hydrolase family 5 protein [Ignavibacteriales bacterium]